MPSVALLSPTAVLVDGVPLGAPAAAILARPELALDIAFAVIAYERAQIEQAHSAQLATANQARAQALVLVEASAAATTAAQEAKATAEASLATAEASLAAALAEKAVVEQQRGESQAL
jgi:hypothetical protein